MLTIILDLLLITLLAAGIIYAARLIKQLATLRASRGDMERFVMDFNGSVLRAESSMKGLKQAARSSGDDLEQLIEKAEKMMDELNFLVESADLIASRLSDTASTLSASTKPAEPAAAKPAPKPAPVASAPEAKPAAPASAAEKDLLKALEKMG